MIAQEPVIPLTAAEWWTARDGYASQAHRSRFRQEVDENWSCIRVWSEL